MSSKSIGFLLSAAVIFAMVFGAALNASATIMGGSIQGTAINVSPSTVSTLAGTAGVAGSANGTGPAASFHWPYGITTDGTNLYVTDNFNNTIRKIVIATGAVTTLAGTAGVSGYLDASGPAAKFNGPTGITTDGTFLYVAEITNCTIRKIRISNGDVTTLAGTALSCGNSATTFNHPRGITYGGGVFLYVADSDNNAIRKVDISTATITTSITTNWPCDITTTGTWLYSTDPNSNAVQVSSNSSNIPVMTYPNLGLNFPQGITTDGSQGGAVVYISDTYNHRIISNSGGTIAGMTGTIGSTDGTSALFNTPVGITTDGTNLYVCDWGNNTIRKIALYTPSVTTYTVTPSAGAGGTLSPSGPVTVNSGATTAFTVTTNSGYSISSVAGCSGHLSGNTYTTGTITSNCTVSASFTAAGTTYTVTPSVAGTGGTISPSSWPVIVNSGATTSFIVTPNAGYIASVGGTCGGALAGTTYTTNAITTNCTVTATFIAAGANLVMAVPASKAALAYPPTKDAVQSDSPMNAKPIGVGKIASGGSKINIYIGLAQFSAPVDIYFAISAPAIDPNNIYLLSPLHLFQAYPAGPLTAWKYNTTGQVSESLFGEFPVSSLPKGTYTLYLVVTPTGSISSYYLWETAFTVN